MKLHPAHIAGVMDSDGSFSIVKRPKKNTKLGFIYRPVVQITWKVSENAEKFFQCVVSTYGGSYHLINKKENAYGKTGKFYKLSIEGNSLDPFLKDIMPFLVLKKIQARSLLQLRSLRKKWFGKGEGTGNSKPVWISNREEKFRNIVRNSNGKNGKGIQNG
jgi:hypothetical protein